MERATRLELAIAPRETPFREGPAPPCSKCACSAGGGIELSPRKLPLEIGAGDEARTRYLHLGKVALYRMSYARIWCLRSESLFR